MDKSMKTIIVIAGIVLAANLIVNLFGMFGPLNDAKKSIKELKSNLLVMDTMLKQSQICLDSVQKNLVVHGNYVLDIQKRVQILDLNRRSELQKFMTSRTEIKKELDSLYHTTSVSSDSLPIISVVTLSNERITNEPKNIVLHSASASNGIQ